MMALYIRIYLYNNMPRKATNLFLSSIISSLSFEPKPISEIAKNAGTSWESTKKALEFLVCLSIVEAKEEGERVLFSKKSLNEVIDNKTFFNLPLDMKDRNMAYFIFENTRKLWLDTCKTEIGRTQMQKILVAVNRDCHLEIPVGRYLYGMMSVVPYQPFEQYPANIPSNNQEILSSIKTTIGRYHNLSIQQLKILHYEETGNILYLAKEVTLKLLFEKEFDRLGFSDFCNSLYDILRNIPKEEQRIREVFTEFISIINRLSILDEDKLKTMKYEISSTFDEIWKFVALSIFCKDLKRFYSEQQLMHLNFEIINQIQIVDEQLSSLSEFVPKREDLKCPEYEALKKLQGSVSELKIIAEEKAHKLAEESAKEPSKIFREFDLN